MDDRYFHEYVELYCFSMSVTPFAQDSGNSSGGFFSCLKDKFLDFLARNGNYLPGVCTAGAFGFGTGRVAKARISCAVL